MRMLSVLLIVMGLTNYATAVEDNRGYSDAVVNVLLQQHRVGGNDVQDWRQWDYETSYFLKNNKLSSLEARKYLLIIFATDVGDLTYTSEFISKTIVEKFVDNKQVILDALKDMPYTNKSYCMHLIDYFDLFGDDGLKNSFFLKQKEISLICGKHG